ncbi:nucleotidyltransferase domain-containing protein [Noviherbaspirillum galbum]|uniref:Nucleotidyltransferase family protein n=1 Tax=Noviherbaspirillum galbum TaxID=2709383 RepID=A0A6B3SWE7_9BURK|nr:nucleotidyltransferase [Noviherbaspirillum galbum]NEX63276.1 nucleotidyltransferase family protein [Noviherbaspirillum galbum]
MLEPIATALNVGTAERDPAVFYRHVLHILNGSRIPYLVGGAWAFNQHTTINRSTKDLDLFIRRRDFDAIADLMRESGYDAELTFPHWLGKIHCGGIYIDLIFSSGNAIAEVDDAWFEHAREAEVLGMPVRISPVEEMIWSKAFIMERERYDGADVLHLLRECGPRLDWGRLFRRFESHWRVLLSHLVLFGFAYPGDRHIVPVAVMDELVERLRKETHSDAPAQGVCLGTLLSREQFLSDVERQGLRDGRVKPLGNMTPEDTQSWTEAIKDDHEPQ